VLSRQPLLLTNHATLTLAKQSHRAKERLTRRCGARLPGVRPHFSWPNGFTSDQRSPSAGAADLIPVRPRKASTMDTASSKQKSDRTHFVEPSLRPSPQQPSRRRIAIGVAILLIGFVATFFGSSSAFGQALIIGGSILVVASLFLLCPDFPVGRQPERDREDTRKLYGTNKA
jgi:hypothetical protein